MQEIEHSILDRIELQSHFDRLLDVKKYVKPLLTDLTNIIKSTTEVNRNTNKRRFVQNFARHETQVQHIAYVLTEYIPAGGLSKSLIEVFVEITDCSLTDLTEFQKFYMDIVSSAIAIDLANERFTDNLFNQTKSDWEERVKMLYPHFERKFNECIASFPQLVMDDFRDNLNATDLQRKNALRYSDKLNSVISVAKDTDCSISYLKQDGYIFIDKTERMVVLFEKKYDIKERSDHNESNLMENSTKEFPNHDDVARLMNKTEGSCDKAGKLIEDMFFWRGYRLRFRLIMDDKPQNLIAVDQSSRLTQIKICGKIIVIAVEEGNVSDLDYQLELMKPIRKTTSGVAIQTINTILIVCLMMTYLVSLN